MVSGWVAKAESDLANAGLCLSAEQALDTACFHAQQAAEKCIKAYLTAREVAFPYIHNLEKLIELCVEQDPSFSDLKADAQALTPFAVELRYDSEFWPELDTAREAYEMASAIKQFVLERLHPQPDEPGS